MAQVDERGVGRLSHVVVMTMPPGAPLSLDEAMAEVRTRARSQWAQLINSQMDTITQGVVTFDYLSGEQIHQFSIAMPANQAPIGVRDGAGFNAAINTLRQNVLRKLDDLRLRGTDAQIIGVREVRLYVVAGPRMQARAAYDGNGYVVLPQALRNKCCVLNIKNTDNRCIQYCLVAHQMWKAGTLPPNHADQTSYYHDDRYAGMRKGLKPLKSCGLDLKAFDGEGDITDQIQVFQQDNPDVGIYIYEWIE